MRIFFFFFSDLDLCDCAAHNNTNWVCGFFSSDFLLGGFSRGRFFFFEIGKLYEIKGGAVGIPFFESLPPLPQKQKPPYFCFFYSVIFGFFPKIFSFFRGAKTPAVERIRNPPRPRDPREIARGDTVCYTHFWREIVWRAVVCMCCFFPFFPRENC